MKHQNELEERAARYQEYLSALAESAKQRPENDLTRFVTLSMCRKIGSVFEAAVEIDASDATLLGSTRYLLEALIVSNLLRQEPEYVFKACFAVVLGDIEQNERM